MHINKVLLTLVHFPALKIGFTWPKKSMLSSLFNMKGYLPFSLALLERVAVAVVTVAYSQTRTEGSWGPKLPPSLPPGCWPGQQAMLGKHTLRAFLLGSTVCSAPCGKKDTLHGPQGPLPPTRSIFPLQSGSWWGLRPCASWGSSKHSHSNPTKFKVNNQKESEVSKIISHNK